MGTITTEAGVEIFYKDWGKGQPIVFSHGWPPQMLFFQSKGYRVARSEVLQELSARHDHDAGGHHKCRSPCLPSILSFEGR